MSAPQVSAPPAPTIPSLARNPQLTQWITICDDGRVLVRSGKVELGQGVLTALTQIVGEELDVDTSRVRMMPAATGANPDESYTSGSLSVQHSGGALRQVCAQVRGLYLAAAADRLGVAAADLHVQDGTIQTADGRSTSYWELAGTVELDCDVVPCFSAKGPGEYRTVGNSLHRLDVPDKVAGRPRFVHDLRPSGMLFGRVLRPPSPGAVLLSVDDAGARDVPGVVAVVRDGAFLGVVAQREENALRALEALRAGSAWRQDDALPAEERLAEFLLTAPSETVVLRDERTEAAPTVDGRSIRARFLRPYTAHGSIAPSCALAEWNHGRLHVWSHTQGIYNLRAEISRSLALPAEDVIVQHVEGAGCYGHNGADDAAYDAALLARAVPGRPVQVVWSRSDELSWSPFGPAMLVEIQADIDESGHVQRWQHDTWSNGHTGRPSGPGDPPLLAAMHVEQAAPAVPSADPPVKGGGGSGRNALPGYELPQQLVRTHVLQTMPLRTSALRALGAHLNVYAIESVIDELATLAGVNALEYRLGLLTDPRARDVLSAAAERAGWGQPLDDGFGRGLGFARYKGAGAYCAVVAEVEAESSLRVVRLTIAADVGLVVNPDGVVNQLEGGALQSVSWTTKERVRFDTRQVTSQDWEGYPILTFSEAPSVDVLLLDRPDQPSVGAGEAPTGPVAAAVGNALHAATGVRVRTLPLSRETIIAAMNDVL